MTMTDEVLRGGTLYCPADGERLHFELFAGMRVKRRMDDGSYTYHARCPKCGNYHHVQAPRES